MKGTIFPALRQSFLLIPAAAVMIFFLHFFRLVDFHELDALDLRFRLRGEIPADPSIVLVMVDDASLSALGQWPWPRSHYAGFLEVLSSCRPRAVFFDVLFTDPSPDPGEDEQFSFAVKKSGNVILPFYFQTENPFRASFPIPSLLEAARGTGFVNVSPDDDGRIRRVRAEVQAGSGVYYQPSVQIKLWGLSAGAEGRKWIKKIPRGRDGNFLINFPGNLNSFQKISFKDVVDAAGTARHTELEKLFRDKIVFFGHTATGTTDLRPMPFSTGAPGIIVQASVMHTLLGRRMLRPFPELAHLFLLLLLSAGIHRFFRRMNPLKGFAWTMGIMAGYALLNFLAFVFGGLILPLYVPLFTMLTVFALTHFLKYAEIMLQKEMTERELGMAAKIQENFLPRAMPLSPLLDAACECRFTKQVGGDFYDWTDLGKNRFAFSVGDVSGKGMPAALYMIKAFTDFRSLNKVEKNSGEVCTSLNRILASENVWGMFVTVLYVVADLESRKLQFASAGHEYGLMFRAAVGKVEVLKELEQGMPVGLFEEARYETAETSIASGDVLILYSDGVKELRNPAREEFGLERLREALELEARKAEASAQDILRGIFARMELHQRGTDAHDDCTLAVIRFL